MDRAAGKAGLSCKLLWHSSSSQRLERLWAPASKHNLADSLITTVKCGTSTMTSDLFF